MYVFKGRYRNVRWRANRPANQPKTLPTRQKLHGTPEGLDLHLPAVPHPIHDLHLNFQKALLD